MLAILQDETGQQQTVRLTPDQAAALGIDYQQLLAAAAAAAGGVSSAAQTTRLTPSPELPTDIVCTYMTIIILH